ncbi:MAG: uroporphyrinogen decarboxylase family protein [Candidatus Hydrogenedentales bacterium]|jgi:uroporphyrinogen decarboxylase
MKQRSKELVWRTLRFENPERIPRQLWYLPWAELYHQEELNRIQQCYPDDILWAPNYYDDPLPTQGDSTAIGRYIDEFGCEFINIQEGVIGEVKNPQILDWERDAPKIRFPKEYFSLNKQKVNAWCADRDQFILTGCCPRPFEQLQFLRGSADLYMDLLLQPPAMFSFMEKLHAFYCDLLKMWVETDVDGLMFMDDWGSQQSLLIAPDLWRELFKPMYRDYIKIAHDAGKAAFMHSDGYTIDIFPDLVELELDALNAQLFCIGVEKVAPFAGKLCFWGEMDRQNLLVNGTPEEMHQAVRQVYDTLWRQGGCIAQCEFGPGANPANVEAVFSTWDLISEERAAQQE